MEIEYKGANCVIISGKKTVIAIDPKLSSVGLKDAGNGATAELATQKEFAVNAPGAMTIDMPGEYEISGASIRGIAAQKHIDNKEAGKQATIYTIELSGIKICVVGHIVAPLTDDELEAINVVDIAIVPVGGNGYTLDSHEAVKVVRQLDPKIVIPTHFADKAIKYEVEQGGLEEFVKELAAPVEIVDKLKIKNGILPDGLTLYELTRSS